MRFASLLTFTALCSAVAAPAFAVSDDLLAADRFQIRGRVIGVLPDESSNASIGGEVLAGDAVTPEVDLSYFVTDNVSLELIAATAQHSLSHSTAGDLGRTWILPPTLTLQYHFDATENFRPYVGAGLNYTFFYAEESAKGNGITDLHLKDGIGYALQAGADYWLDRNWGVNVDVKKLYLATEAKLNNGGITANVDLDPWIVGAGVAYRF